MRVCINVCVRVYVCGSLKIPLCIFEIIELIRNINLSRSIPQILPSHVTKNSLFTKFVVFSPTADCSRACLWVPDDKTNDYINAVIVPVSSGCFLSI